MKITLAPGDGVGPEIMDVVLDVFRKAQVPLEWEVVSLGGGEEGIGNEARASVERTGVLLKGPVAHPLGGSEVGLDQAARRVWGTFAQKSVYRTLPGVPTPLGVRPMRLTMIRELAGEDYESRERMLTPDVATNMRFTTRTGAQRLHRYAFETAARKGAQRITCAHRAHVNRLSDGLFLDTFYEVSEKYPQIEVDDIGTDELARRILVEPERFDVIVLPALEGDLLTDLAAGLVGGLEYACTANVGDDFSLFEVMHGTSPDKVGLDRANPTALLLSGTMMLRHLGLGEYAQRIESALERTLYQMHRRRDIQDFVSGFRTSIFRYLMLSELAKQAAGDAGPAPWELQRELDQQNPGGRGLALPSMADQLEGLA